MIIKLDEKYYIDGNRYSYDLKENTGRFNSKEEPIINTHGYYPTVKMAVKRYIELMVLENDELSLSEYVEELSEQTNRLEELLDD